MILAPTLLCLEGVSLKKRSWGTGYCLEDMDFFSELHIQLPMNERPQKATQGLRLKAADNTSVVFSPARSPGVSWMLCVNPGLPDFLQPGLLLLP